MSSNHSNRTVWIYNDLPPGVVAGASLMADNWQRALPAFGLTPRLFAPSGSARRTHDSDSVTFRTMRNVGYPGDWHARFSLLAELRRVGPDRPDAIIVATPLRVGTLGLATASIHGIPLVVVHSSDMSSIAEYFGSFRAMASAASKLLGLHLLSAPVRSAFWRREAMAAAFRTRRHAGVITVHGIRAIYSEAAAIVVLGEKMRREVDSWNMTVPVHTIPLGVDRLPVRDSPVTVKWPEGRLRLLYVGRFSREKNVELLIHAVRHATDRGVDVHLALCGEGHMVRRLRALVTELGLDDRVDLIGPFPHDELQAVYSSADVFVFPSRADSQAMALNEAALEGLPMIGCDPHVNAVLVDGQSGIVIEDDAEQWAGAIETMTDADVRRSFGLRARELAERSSEKSQMFKLASVVHDAIDRARSGH
ncbi:glycosyltransferase [Rhodococcus sp. P1Y]|uniref:glycosyltransferase n=1 Tax=Rhodococcus sp. P1Y TaxID=1302308 RepID=UPI000EB15B36|nr:glycosyltransferase [Rhodococcus sp. P1Y]AYJ49727.1 glycosyltransferase [Rhodococcus sp. P1Y]